ncbi:MAG: PIG-L family deacetylase [Bacteroidetes bacterium]|nr:PIG-L family deacetylase [Bacteroidota bacterium]
MRSPHKEKILVLAPHTDDGELGCGGSMHKFINQGDDVYYAVFSLAEESVPDGWPKDILRKEVSHATQTIGIPPDNLLIFKYPVRKFSQFRQEILEDMVRLNQNLKPDVVYMPSQFDLHQDHTVIANEGLRAFRNCTIIGYELPWNNIQFEHNLFVILSKKEIDKKMEALRCYQSQTGKIYFKEEFIKGLATSRGVQVSSEFAEAFKVIRWIIR